MLARQLVDFEGEGRVGRATDDVLPGFAGVEQIQDVLENGPALGLLEGDEVLQTLEGGFGDVDELGPLLLEPDEAHLDHLDAGNAALADPLLQTAAVRQVLLEHQRALRFLYVLDPPSVRRRFNERADQAALDRVVRFFFEAVDAHCSVDVDVVQLDFYVLFDVLQILLLLLLFRTLVLVLFLRLLSLLAVSLPFPLADLAGSEQIFEDLGILGGSETVVF